MTEPHELNKPVICLVYGACGVTQQIKSPRMACDDRFRRPALLTLSIARRGCAQTINCSRSQYIFWFGYKRVGSAVHDKISIENSTQTNNHIVGSIGSRPVGQLRRSSWYCEAGFRVVISHIISPDGFLEDLLSHIAYNEVYHNVWLNKLDSSMFLCGWWEAWC